MRLKGAKIMSEELKNKSFRISEDTTDRYLGISIISGSTHLSPKDTK